MRTCAFLAGFLVMFFATISPLSAQTDGLEYSEDVVFTVLDDSVRVDLAATMTNNTVERRNGDTVLFTFFETFVFIAPTGLTDLSITTTGTQLSSTQEPLDDDFDVVTAVLPTQLRSGESRSFDVSYTLPRGELRSNSAFFSNPAYHGFPLWSSSDPGTGSLVLRVPVDAEVAELSETIAPRAVVDGFNTWEPLEFGVPTDFFTYVNVVREDRLEERNFAVSGQDIVVQSWPGDTEWADFAQEAIEQGIPTLEEHIGTPIPDQDTLEVTASLAPFLFGFAGWYDPTETSIEIGNELDRGVMLHELSHAWFNHDLFVDRWVIEGLAEEVSFQVDRELDGRSRELPTRPRSTDAGAAPLNDWSTPFDNFANADLRERELYGYNASWFAVRELADIVGDVGLRQIILAADTEAPAYRGATRSLLLNDWRRLLDLASVVTDAEGEAALNQLWLDLVVNDAEAPVLAERSEAREAYRRFQNRPLEWLVPAEIDQAMADWRFEDALELLGEANRVLDLQRRVIDQAGLAGLQAAEAGRVAYERPDPDFDGAVAVLVEQEAAIESVLQVRQLVAQPLTREERVGLGDFDLGSIAELAEEAYALNRFDDVVLIGERLQETRTEAQGVGRSRILWSRLGLGVAVAGVLYAIFRVISLRPWREQESVSA